MRGGRGFFAQRGADRVSAHTRDLPEDVWLATVYFVEFEHPETKGRVSFDVLCHREDVALHARCRMSAMKNGQRAADMRLVRSIGQYSASLDRITGVLAVETPDEKSIRHERWMQRNTQPIYPPITHRDPGDEDDRGQLPDWRPDYRFDQVVSQYERGVR